MTRSRLSRRLEQKSKKNLLLSVLGIVLVILIAFKFGIPFLANLSFLISGASNKEEIKLQDPSFIAPPVLDSFPQATRSAEIVISGIASKNQTVNLYINDELIDNVDTKDDGRFSFEITLKPGENSIKTKSIVKSRESDFSNTVITAYKSAPPSLNIDSPSNNQSFSKDQKSIEVRGTTDADVRLTVNGFWAITDTSGEFSYRLPLQNGENKIKVIATDLAGNKTEKEINVSYSP